MITILFLTFIISHILNTIPSLALGDTTTNLSTQKFDAALFYLLEENKDDLIMFNSEITVMNVEISVFPKENNLKVYIVTNGKESPIAEHNCKLVQIGATHNNDGYIFSGLKTTKYRIICSDISLFSEFPVIFRFSYDKKEKQTVSVTVEYTVKVAIHSKPLVQATIALLFDNIFSTYKKSEIRFKHTEVSLTYLDSDISNLKNKLTTYFLVNLFGNSGIHINPHFEGLIEQNKTLSSFFTTFLERHNLYIKFSFNKKEAVLEIDFKNATIREINTNIMEKLKNIKSMKATKIEFRLKSDDKKTHIEIYDEYGDYKSSKQYEMDTNEIDRIDLFQFEKVTTKDEHDKETLLDGELIYSQKTFDFKNIIKDDYFILAATENELSNFKHVAITILKSQTDKIGYLSNLDYMLLKLAHEIGATGDEHYIKTFGAPIGKLLETGNVNWESSEIFNGLVYSTETFISSINGLTEQINSEVNKMLIFSDKLHKIDVFINHHESGMDYLPSDAILNTYKYNDLTINLYEKEAVLRHSFFYISTPFEAIKIMLNKLEIKDFLETNKNLTLEVEFNQTEKAEIFDYSYKHRDALFKEKVNRLNKDVALKLKLNEDRYYDNRFIYNLTLDRDLKHDLKLSSDEDKTKFILGIVERCMFSSRIFHLKKGFYKKDIIYKYGDSFADPNDVEKNSMLTYVFLAVYLAGMLLVVGQITFT